jgi:hypothetical protein
MSLCIWRGKTYVSIGIISYPIWVTPFIAFWLKKNGVPDGKFRENKKSPGEIRGFFRIQLYGTLLGPSLNPTVVLLL